MAKCETIEELKGLVTFLAHPVRGEDESECMRNLESAKKWFEALAYYGVVVVAPWITLCEKWPEVEPYRSRGIEHNKTVIRRCQGMIMVGGRISEGMRHEYNFATSLGLPILDWSNEPFDLLRLI